MSDIFILNYILNPGNAARYWYSYEGKLFFQCLKKKGIEHALYAGNDVDVEINDLACGCKLQWATVEQVKMLMEYALQRYEAVFFISDSPGMVSSFAEKEGCLSVLLSEKGKLNLENDKYLEISMLSCLNVYFEEQLPRHLLVALRKRPENYKTRIEARNARIKKQIKLSGGVYIFGSNTIAKQVYQECRRSEIKVLGFVDNDLNKQKTSLYNLPILGPANLSASHDVIILASGNYSYDIYQQLKNLQFEYIQNLSEFYYAVNCRSQPEPSFHDDLSRNIIRYHALYFMLADSVSRNVLEALVQYRQNLELSSLSQIYNKQNLQWFDRAFFTPSADHVFVDGGGYDGDTALRFISMNGASYRAIHIFELDPSITKRAEENLKEHECVYVHNLGLSNKKGTLFMVQTGLTDGRLIDGNGVPVKVDAIDNVVKEKITLLKLDVEGAEEDAITGAAKHIRNDIPILAIAAYHKAEDLWSLPRQILNINPDYLLYLRHYTQVAYETVIYCLPKSDSLNRKADLTNVN